jgi:predicted NUDIX family NTP pyrophosphohydrolase
MPRTSAALLAYLLDDGPDPARPPGLSVFLGHMGGPFWAHKDEGAWSIPKGEFDASAESPADAARREFLEEIGVAPPDGPVADLGAWVQPSGKRVHAFAVRAHERLEFVASNEFELEWPRGSGRIRSFPEIDRAEWFPLDLARRKVVGGQVPILDALARAVG